MKAKSLPHAGLTTAIGLLTLLAFLLLLANATLSVAATPYDYTWTDNFDGSSLHPLWSWEREDATHWSLTERPGFLRIISQQGRLLGPGGDAKNLLLQSAPLSDFEIRTHVFFTPTANFHIAGLLIYQDDDNFLMLGRAYCGFIPPCVGNGIYFDHEEGGSMIGSNFAITTTLQGEAYLRVVREGTTYSGYYSEDGVNWTLIGRHTVGSGFTPSRIGLAAEDSGTGAPEISADFDFFQLEGNFPVFDYTRADDFSSATLGSRWSWINEDPTQWSLSAHPGFLRIMTHPGYVGDKNLLFQSAPMGDFEISTHIIFTPTRNFQIAGLVLYQDSGNYLMLGRAYCGAPPPWCVGNGIYFDRVEGGKGKFVGSNFATSTTNQGEAYLRVIREGAIYSGYYSEDGTSWILIGRHTPSDGIVLSKIGLTVAQDYWQDIPIPADFDFFRLTANYQKVFLPLVLKNN